MAIKDDVEIGVSVRFLDKFVFHNVTKVTETSAKTSNDVNVYVFSQCYVIIIFCSFIPLPDKNRDNLLSPPLNCLS